MVATVVDCMSHEFVKSRGMTNRKALLKQKSLDQAKRDQKQLAKDQLAAKHDKIQRRSVAHKNGVKSYEACMPTASELRTHEFDCGVDANANHTEEVAIVAAPVVVEEKTVEEEAEWELC